MRRRGDIHWGQVALYGGIALGLYLFWNNLALYPLRILVVFFHEVGHALTAWATGGQIVGIQLDPYEGGYCVTRGGNRFLILSSGYIGSVVTGAGLILASRVSKKPEIAVCILGGLLACVTLAWVRPFASFGFAFGLIMGLSIAAAAFAMPRLVNASFLTVLGVLSCFYAIWDIYSDVLARPGTPSDAFLLAEATGIPAVVWGLLWMVVAIAVTGECLVRACRKSVNPTNRSDRSV